MFAKGMSLKGKDIYYPTYLVQIMNNHVISTPSFPISFSFHDNLHPHSQRGQCDPKVSRPFLNRTSIPPFTATPILPLYRASITYQSKWTAPRQNVNLRVLENFQHKTSQRTQHSNKLRGKLCPPFDNFDIGSIPREIHIVQRLNRMCSD